VLVLMEHVARRRTADRPQDPAAVHLTADRRRRRQRIITDLAVIDVTPAG
jgi:acyl CoA:acetate/3-ketoacid CoA transferase beta subunit